MGFFSKIWKGIKKGFKKVFKPIKKVFTSFGKFMNKIGIVGQIAMAFILPAGIGSMLSEMFSHVVGSLAGGSLGGIGKAAGWVLGKAHEFGKLVGAGYKTVTGAVTDFIGTAGKYIGGKLNIGDLPNMTMGEAWGEYTGKLSDSFSKLGDAATEFWDMDIKGSTGSHLKLAGASPLRREALDPLHPESSYQADLQSKLDIKPFETIDPPVQGTGVFDPKFDPQEMNDAGYFKVKRKRTLQLDPVTGEHGFSPQSPPSTPVGMGLPELKTGYWPESETFNPEIDGYGTPVTSTASAAATTQQEQGFISKSLEALTGEKTWGDAGRKLVRTTGDSLLAAPGQAVASTLTTGLGQAVGFLPKPQEQKDPGPQWGGYAPQYVSQQYVSMPQQTQQMPSAFSEFAMGQSLNTDPNGSWLGNAFWSDYMRRAQSFA